jgi:hypothetical protein
MNDEMRAAQLNYWGSFIYGNCAHGWTDPNSGAYRQREGEEAHDIMLCVAAHPHPTIRRPTQHRFGPWRMRRSAAQLYVVAQWLHV